MPDRQVQIAADAATELPLAIPVPARTAVEQRNAVRIAADITGHPLSPAVPVALPGAQAWRVYLGSDPAEPDRLSSRDAADDSAWRELTVDANRLPLPELLADSDQVMLQHFLEVPEGREVRLGVDCTATTKVWLNGSVVIDVEGPRLIRPSYGVGEHVNPIVKLEPGFNELLVSVRREGDGEIEGHTFLSTADRLRHGVVDVGRTRYPWD